MLYRGEHPNQSGSQSVLLLLSASPHPELGTISKLKREYSLKDELESTWAVRPLDLCDFRGRMTLVLEESGGVTLDQLISRNMEIEQLLRIAIGLASALSNLHKIGLIHKDVKPANVMVDPSGHIRLMGFGIASSLPRERQAPGPPEFIAGTFPYMAPEQTGRMNRSIDSRSDLYALGVTLYELMTGSLPFSAHDPMEWVYCHIARQPAPLGEKVKGIPGMVSAIIMKLLAKTGDERYQTAAGLERDLRRCLDQWERQRQIDYFPPGQEDISDRLVIPEKLYGREREIGALLATFDRVVAGGRSELLLVAGYSGIGKSSVVNELHKPLVLPRGLFASGKFDQYQRTVPYSTLAQAFQSLLHQLLTKSESELSGWRGAFREALDTNGQLITDLVPELKLIIGEPPPVPQVSSQNAQARLQQVFARFIGVFARQEHPLALFLDDLQWADVATLDLIADLLTRPEVRYLLLIGAYRENEVGPSHPLMRKLEAIRATAAVVQSIRLSPLSRETLALLMEDSLHCKPEEIAPLAELVHQKTEGNPFFSIQFISALAEEGLLNFDHTSGKWIWQLNRIRAKEYTDNVVALLVGKLSRLPAGTQEALRQLACFGSSSDFTLLETIFGDSTENMHSRLWEAVRAGFVFRSENSYHFLHDRVQEAAYSLIPEQSRGEMHLRIGRLLAERVPPNEREERIFEIVNQFNRASDLLSSGDERKRVAEFNLIAARRAKLAIAYSSALSFLAAGRSLLTDMSWDSDYELVFSIEILRAECELLTADMESAEKRLSMLAARVKKGHHLAVTTRLQLTLYTALDRLDRGIELCLEFLRRARVNWPAHPVDEDVQREYDRIWSLLGNRKIEALIDEPLVSDPDILDVLEVLSELITPAVFFDRNLCALVICHLLNVSLEHGSSSEACFAYVWFGIVAGPRFGNYKDAFRFARLGLDMLEKRGLKRYEARTCFCFASIIIPWTQHVRHSRSLLRHAFDIAYRTGDFTYAAYTFTQLVTNFLAVGDPLEEAQAQAEKGIKFAEAARVGLVVDIVKSDLQLIRSLRGLTSSFGSFNNQEFNEAEFEQLLASNPALADPAFGYWTLKTEARFFAGDYGSAVDASLRAQQLLWAAPSLLEPVTFRFYSALSHAAAWNSASLSQRQQHFEFLTAHQQQLQLWAEHCPDNFSCHAALAAAEIARIEGRWLDAERLYEDAIRSARAGSFIQIEAVACELAGQFYTARGLEKVADTYLREARYCYLRWGAQGKVKQLDVIYPQLTQGDSTPGATNMIAAHAELLDLSTVIKVSQAVSAEMDIDSLIETVMRAALEHAGANRGLLIIWRGDGQHTGAEATAEGEQVFVKRNEFVRLAVPSSVINYVTRTHEFTILDDASSPNRFSADAYFTEHRVGSVLCLPLITRGKLIGLLYLENSLAPHVFTPNRIAVLKWLASQAAISLENAQLYVEVRQRETKVRRLFDANIMAVVIWRTDGTILECNEAFLRMVQYAREDVAGARVHWTDLTPAEWRKHDERALAEITATGSVQPYEKELFRKDGSRVPVLVAGALFDEGGSEGVAFALDLSEQKQAEAERERLREELSHLAHLNRVSTMGELTASLAHEIKQPIGAAVTNAEACLRFLDRDRPDVPEAREAAMGVVKDSRRTADIIDRVRSLYRKDSSKLELIDANEIIAEMVLMLNNEAKRHSVTVRTDLGEGLPKVMADRVQLQQVLMNLMLNGIEAMQDKGGELRVRSQVSDIGEVLIAVTDAGVGLPPGKADQIFNAFFTTKSRGTGLGLAITRSIVESHGGRVWVIPNSDAGVTFQFTLPQTSGVHAWPP